MATPEILKSLLDPAYEPNWKKVTDLQPGDLVSWWAQPGEVLASERDGRDIVLTVRDHDGTEKRCRYADRDELNIVGRNIRQEG